MQNPALLKFCARAIHCYCHQGLKSPRMDTVHKYIQTQTHTQTYILDFQRAIRNRKANNARLNITPTASKVFSSPIQRYLPSFSKNIYIYIRDLSGDPPHFGNKESRWSVFILNYLHGPSVDVGSAPSTVNILFRQPRSSSSFFR